jgi:hypothetical protein
MSLNDSDEAPERGFFSKTALAAWAIGIGLGATIWWAVAAMLMGRAQ